MQVVGTWSHRWQSRFRSPNICTRLMQNGKKAYAMEDGTCESGDEVCTFVEGKILLVQDGKSLVYLDVTVTFPPQRFPLCEV